jgi:hypothetical protein
LTPLEQGLEALIGARPVAVDTVVFATFNTMYEALMEATIQATTGTSHTLDPWARLRAVLRHAVVQVTLQGLAEMLQSAPDPAALLAAVEEGRWAYVSPPWGGVHSYVEPRYQFLVLPPMATADLAALQRAAAERHFAPAIVTVNTVAAGCCIVALAFSPVSKRSEVEPPLYHANGVAAQLQPTEEFLVDTSSIPEPSSADNVYDGAPVAQEVNHAV